MLGLNRGAKPWSFRVKPAEKRLLSITSKYCLRCFAASSGVPDVPRVPELHPPTQRPPGVLPLI